MILIQTKFLNYKSLRMRSSILRRCGRPMNFMLERPGLGVPLESKKMRVLGARSFIKVTRDFSLLGVFFCHEGPVCWRVVTNPAQIWQPHIENKHFPHLEVWAWASLMTSQWCTVRALASKCHFRFAHFLQFHIVFQMWGCGICMLFVTTPQYTGSSWIAYKCFIITPHESYNPTLYYGRSDSGVGLRILMLIQHVNDSTWKENQLKTFLAMKFTTRKSQYY